MLSRLASYLLRGAASGADDGEAPPRDDEVSGAPDGVTSIPVEARLRQVEVEGDDWILIDRNVEGFAGMDESWYVTPPACFTQPGPVHVETSPLEDLLIEHPSMSVYRAAGSSSHSDKPEPGKQRGKRRPPVPEAKKPADNNARLPLATRNANLQAVTTATTQVTSVARPEGQASSRSKAKANNNSSNSSSSNNRPSHYHHHHHHHHNQAGAVAEQGPRRSSIRDLRNARGDENVRIVQIRSAQKMLEKRTSQSSKRNRLERGNKAREVSSGKGRRPRRQDRLRLNNSGANNNRKC